MGAPTFRDVAPDLAARLGDQVVVTHTHFDRVAMHQAAAKWATPPLRCVWLDTARVARRTWAECARSGYGLADVCRRIGFQFAHHNALEDAKASGHVLLAALRETGGDLSDVLTRVQQPIAPGNNAGPIGATATPTARWPARLSCSPGR